MTPQNIGVQPVATAELALATNIRPRREQLGVSRSVLAIEAQCSASSIANLESGKLMIWSRALPNVLAALDRLESDTSTKAAT
jgi:predicted transcriptional regulator